MTVALILTGPPGAGKRSVLEALTTLLLGPHQYALDQLSIQRLELITDTVY